jgi:hypothetical protein
MSNRMLEFRQQSKVRKNALENFWGLASDSRFEVDVEDA